MHQETRAHVQRDRGLPKPEESHVYLEKAGEKGAEDGQWVGELCGGLDLEGLLIHAGLLRFYTHKETSEGFSSP